MKKKVIKEINPSTNNGVRSKWLIDLSKTLRDNALVHTTQLSSDGIDKLYVCFKDNKRVEWMAKVYETKIVELLKEEKLVNKQKVLEHFGNFAFEDFNKYLVSLPANATDFFNKLRSHEVKVSTDSNNPIEIIDKYKEMGFSEVVELINYLLKRGYYIEYFNGEDIKLQKNLTEVHFINYANKQCLCIHDDDEGEEETLVILELMGKLFEKYGYKRGDGVIDEKTGGCLEFPDEWYKYI
jgi:hypothetical protein